MIEPVLVLHTCRHFVIEALLVLHTCRYFVIEPVLVLHAEAIGSIDKARQMDKGQSSVANDRNQPPMTRPG